MYHNYSCLTEFNQEFYHTIFNGKTLQDYDELTRRVLSGLSAVDNKQQRLSSLFKNLRSAYDFYRLRLVGIVSKTDVEVELKLCMKQLIACRYITITGLDFLPPTDESDRINMDFSGCVFMGSVVPSTLRVSDP